jgi:CDP-diacylglycerol--glycerol-3-phosphate 3-phosphatidyltransferase
MVSYVKARAEGAGVACDPGILQRPERLIAICVSLLLGPHVMFWVLWLIAALSGVTVAQRFFAAYRGAKTKDRPTPERR